MPNMMRAFLEDRQQRRDYADGNQVVYLGRSNAGATGSEAIWQIRKFTYDGVRILDVNFANGTADYDKIWNDRAKYDFDPDT